jgi:hypothetical protein
MSARVYYIVLVYNTRGDGGRPDLLHSSTRSFDTMIGAKAYADAYVLGWPGEPRRYLRTHIQWVKIDKRYGVMLNE